MHTLHIYNLTQLPEAAAQFADAVKGKRVIAFYGAMGAGKTTFIAALLRHWGVREDIQSPTFAIVSEYDAEETPFPAIYHFDFYRIKSLTEAYDIGIEEYFNSDGLCLIEWPEQIEPLLPEETLRVEICETEGGERELRVKS